MNTLIDIALTIQPLKAHHSPTVEHLCLSWERSCEQTSPCTHPRQQKSLQLARTVHSTYPWPSHKHTQRHSHSTLYKIVTHMSFLNTHTSLSHNPSPGSDFTTQTVSLYFSPFLSWFSFGFHGSVERAITSASVWRPGDEELCGCGQTPGHG